MPGNIHSPTPKLKEGTFFFRPAFLRILSYPPPPGISQNHDQGVSGGSGEGPGGPTPLLLDQNEARRPFNEAPPLSQGLDHRPSPRPPYLKVWIRHWGFQ